MNIKIGEKIKQLRSRDGRKQEDLAKALGVSPQAVSRWEANGGYPDIGLLPIIANYFNITIDELFSYSKDRQDKLKNILDKAEKAINEQENLVECVERLRAAAEEFPSEPKILINLGYALSMLGWQEFGTKVNVNNNGTHWDIEYNEKNIYWQEEIQVFEKVLKMDISSEDYDAIIMLLTITYNQMGYTDKAVNLAMKQNSIIMSREMLLPKATNGEESKKYQGEAIIALLTELTNIIAGSIGNNISFYKSKPGITLLTEYAKFIEKVFEDGNCGIFHKYLCDIYLTASNFESRFGESTDKAFEYFQKAFEHKKIYESIRNTGEYKYTAALVSNVTFPSENFPSEPSTFWKDRIEVLPEEFKERIKADSAYAECFEG
ncbi:MAG: helix-turn-helix transcriptional regulator [Ruminococcaceae bacterium]|nr:helix-turn-helix transcriptional regulator [Oscillospiraceae bacterium]